MLQLLLFSVLASVVVEASLADGQKLGGELRELLTDRVVMAVGGQVRTLSRQELGDLAFPPRDEAKPETVAFVQLVDDSEIPCDGVELKQGQLRVRSTWGNWTAPDTAIRAIRWLGSGEQNDEEWNDILGRAASEDLLVIRRDTNLDYLSGVILGVNEQAVQFGYSGTTIPVPFSKVAGIILARKVREMPNPRVRVSTRDGGHWMLESVDLQGDKLALVSVAQVKGGIPLREVTRVEFPQLDAVYLSDLEPSTVTYVPFFGSSEIEDTLRHFANPQLDRSFDGQALRLSDADSLNGWRAYRRGLAVQSKTELVYRLAAKYRRFLTTAGLDPSAPSQGHVRLSLYADDDVVYTRTIDKADAPIQIDVDVSGVRRLRVVVDYGDHLDIGDRLHLGDARLTK